MAATTDVYVDTTKIKNELLIFNNLSSELDDIKRNSNISDVLLVPKEFYNGCTIGEKSVTSNYNLSAEYNNIFDNYVNTINSIKSYIQQLEDANSKGSITTLDLSTVGTITEAIKTGSITAIVNKVAELKSKVDTGETTGKEKTTTNLDSGNGKTTEIDTGNTEEKTDELVDEETTVDENTPAETEETTSDLDTNGKIIEGSETSAGEKNITELDEITGTNGEITTVDGNKVIDTIRDELGNVVAVAVQAGDKIIWYQVVNGSVIGATTITGGTYKLEDSITINTTNGPITISAGEYKIDSVVHDANVNISTIEVICGEYKLILHLDSDGIISKVEYIKLENNGTYKIEDPITINTTNGPVTISAGEYAINNVIYNINGNISTIEVICGEYKLILHLDSDGKISKVDYIKIENNGTYKLEDSITINTTGGPITIGAGEYAINKVIYDTNGNISTIELICGEYKLILHLDSNGKISKVDYIKIESMGTYKLENPVTINTTGGPITISAGDYQIDAIIYDANGNVSAIRVICGDYKLVLHFDSNGNINNIDYIKTETGVFVVNNVDYDIYDIYGNNLGKFENGKYYIYEVMYDKDGKVIAIRVSPDGEYEKWLYFNENTKESDYSFFNTNQSNGKTSVSLFEKNKGLLGLMGVLFIAVGATIVMKKKKKQQEVEDDNEYEYQDNAVQWEENELSTGNYPIYDVKSDDEGNVVEARINPPEEDDEYWVEV